MQLMPHEVAIGVIRGDFDDGCYPDPRTAFSFDEAIAFLEDLTGELLGTDTNKWEQWFADCPVDILAEFYSAYDDLVHSANGRQFKQRCEFANDRWRSITERRCPKCNSLCPEYRKRCWVCRFEVGCC